MLQFFIISDSIACSSNNKCLMSSCQWIIGILVKSSGVLSSTGGRTNSTSQGRADSRSRSRSVSNTRGRRRSEHSRRSRSRSETNTWARRRSEYRRQSRSETNTRARRYVSQKQRTIDVFQNASKAQNNSISNMVRQPTEKTRNRV